MHGTLRYVQYAWHTRVYAVCMAHSQVYGVCTPHSGICSVYGTCCLANALSSSLCTASCPAWACRSQGMQKHFFSIIYNDQTYQHILVKFRRFCRNISTMLLAFTPQWPSSCSSQSSSCPVPNNPCSDSHQNHARLVRHCHRCTAIAALPP